MKIGYIGVCLGFIYIILDSIGYTMPTWYIMITLSTLCFYMGQIVEINKRGKKRK